MEAYKDGDVMDDINRFDFCQVCGKEYDIRAKSIDLLSICPEGHQWKIEFDFENKLRIVKIIKQF